MRPTAWSRTAVGLVVGGITLLLVTALLTAAVYSFSASGQVKAAIGELRDNAETSDARSERAQRERSEMKDQNTKLLGQNRAVLKQNEELRRQVGALVSYLRAHGIEVPKAPALVVKAAPKKRHAKPKLPEKAKPPMPAPKPDPLCEFSVVFCDSFEFPKVVWP